MVKRIRILRIFSYCAVQLPNGFIDPADGLERQCEIVPTPAVWFRRPEFQFEASDRLVKVAFAEIRHAKKKIHFGILRFVGEYLLETLDRRSELQLGLLQYAEALEGFKIAWGKRERLQVDMFRRLVISGLFSCTRLFEKGS